MIPKSRARLAAALLALGLAGAACSKKTPQAEAPSAPPEVAASPTPTSTQAAAPTPEAPKPEAAEAPGPMPKDFARHLEDVARKAYRVPPEVQFHMGKISASETPGLNQVELTFNRGEQKFNTTVYVSQNWKYFFPARLDVYVDYAKILTGMNLQGRPTMGPANAPVTIVEYSDFQ